jgi:hypothetical protein
MVLETCSAKPRERSNAALMHRPDLRPLHDLLESRPRRDVVLALKHPYLASWLSYLARRHRVHLPDPGDVSPTLEQVPRLRGGAGLAELSTGAMVLTGPQGAFARVDPGDMRLLGSGEWFLLWQAGSRGWAVPLGISNPNGLEALDGRPYFWIGGPPTALDVLAGGPGELVLSADFRPGPIAGGGSRRSFVVRTSAGHEQRLATEGGELSARVPLPAGRTRITLEALDAPAPPGPGQADLRPMVLGVHGLSLAFVPNPTGR